MHVRYFSQFNDGDYILSEESHGIMSGSIPYCGLLCPFSKFLVNVWLNWDQSGNQSATSNVLFSSYTVAAEEFFNNVRTNCTLRGMPVNDLKNQLICVTSAINYELRSFIRLPGSIKGSEDALKVVGFTFGRRPGAGERIKALRRSYGARAWILRYLRRVELFFFLEWRPLSRHGRPTGIWKTGSAFSAPGAGVS